ncbi:MAG: C1 family peptidase [Bacteroidota bacterium]
MKKVVLSLTILLTVSVYAQDTIRNKKNGGYLFKMMANCEANDVQDQSRTSTCWSFSSLSFFESELMRMGKGKHNLSEMFVVRNAYVGKAEMYVRMNGFHNFGPGGAFHDLPWVIRRYGIMPEEAYKGLNYGTAKHNHAEMDAVLKGVVDAVKGNPQGRLTTSWKEAFAGAVDAYLGKVPTNFTYQGKNYTPMSFSNSLGLNMDDYVSLTSFTHHPYYSQFAIEVPDNWAMVQSYNLPLEELQSVAEHAITKGYTWAWAADVSEKGFSFKNGVAIVPVHDSLITQVGKDSKGFNDAGAQRTGNAFDKPMTEKNITDSVRQVAFDNYETTDDHGMHATAIVVDQNGNKYFKIKNSWGTGNDCAGYLYCSMPYFRYKTLNIYIHKSALPKDIAKKLGL